MTTTICVINLKGGVAKTTTTVATAQVLAGVHGKKVLIIDLDPQTNASIMLVGEDRWEELNDAGHTVAQLFRDALEPKNRRFDIGQAVQTKVGNVSDARTVSLLSSSLDLIAIQDKLASMPRGQYYSDSPIDVLRKSVKPILGEYDVVLIDCPPSLGLVTLNGLRIADGFMIPVVPDFLSTYGIPQILERVESFSRDIVEPIAPFGILATKFQLNSTVHKNQLKDLRANVSARLNVPVFDTVIPQANDLSAAAEYSPTSKTLRQKWGYGDAFKAYLAFAEELLTKVVEVASK